LLAHAEMHPLPAHAEAVLAAGRARFERRVDRVDMGARVRHDLASIVSLYGPRWSAAETPMSVRFGSSRARWVIAAAVLGSGVAFLDGSVVNVALPALQSDLHMNVAQLQ